MLTQKFKLTVLVVAGAAIAAGLSVNQISLERQVRELQTRPAALTEQATPTNTPAPTASPSATIAPTRPYIRFVPRVSPTLTR